MNERPRRSLARSDLFNQPSAEKSQSRRHKPDYWVLILTSLLMGIGLVVVYSISPALAASQHISQSYFITKQLIDVFLGLAVFGLAAYLPLKNWRHLTGPLLAITAIGCLAVLVTPINSQYPAHRWIRLGGFSFQIAELIKLTLILWLAGFLGSKSQESKLLDFDKTFKPLLIALGLVAVVVAKLQSDLGSAGVMIAILAAMAFMIGIPLKRIVLFSGLIVLVVALAISTSSYRRERLASYLHPGADCKGSSYQACQALISVGSGGVFGQGLGYGTQAYGYLPEASNDSIFAIIAEKFGFIGTTAIVAIYGVFFGRIKRIAERSADQFSRLVVTGVLVWISTQMAINVGAMVGVFPLKGITLPLISQGGTSLVFLTAALGLVFQISRYTSYSAIETGNRSETQSNYNSGGRRFRRSYNPPVVARPRAENR